MRPEDVREHLHQQPFEPFRIYMSDGATFDVDHPEMCMVGRSTIYVGVPDPKKRWMVIRLAHCALIHITRIEPLNDRSKRSSRTRKSR